MKTLKKPYTPPGTTYATDHVMDLAASLPSPPHPGALELKGDKYFWRVDYKEVFKLSAEELYKGSLKQG